MAFTGKRQWVELLKAGGGGEWGGAAVSPAFGPQPPSLRPEGWPLPPATAVWVLPSTSGAAALSNAEREGPYAALAAAVLRVPWPRGPPACLNTA